jgi:outer membrane receptor protein involved in Fe transport
LPASCDADLAAIGLSTTQTTVNPDSIKNYEVGAKTTWLDRKLTVNVAAYSIKWNGIQQGLQLPCGFTVTANAGSATSKGAELETEAQIATNVEIGASGSYTAATLDNDEPSFGALRGDQLLNVPVWQYAAHVTYLFTPAAGIRGSARVDLQHTGGSFADYARLQGTTSRDPAFALGQLTLLGARIGFIKDRWDVALLGTNLLNQLARLDRQVSIGADDPGRPRYVINRPRTVGIDVRLSF